MKFKDFKFVIITDKNNRPMSWSSVDNQVCYCDDENWLDDIHPIKVITKKTAKQQIKKSIENRKSWGMGHSKFDYKMMPVDPT